MSKAIKNDKDKFNIDAYILLMSMTISKVNVATLQATGLLIKIQSDVFQIVTWTESTPLIVRHSIVILNYTLNSTL